MKYKDLKEGKVYYYVSRVSNDIIEIKCKFNKDKIYLFYKDSNITFSAKSINKEINDLIFKNYNEALAYRLNKINENLYNDYKKTIDEIYNQYSEKNYNLSLNFKDIKENKIYYCIDNRHFNKLSLYNILKVKCKIENNLLKIIDFKTNNILNIDKIYIFKTYEEASIFRINQYFLNIYNKSITNLYEDYQRLKSKYPEYFI